MHIDTRLAAQAIRNYYADFMQLKTSQTPPGDIAYGNLLKQLSAELEREYPGEGGDAVAVCGSAITSTFVDMIVLAYLATPVETIAVIPPQIATEVSLIGQFSGLR